jgi:hypothetical protein
MLHQDSETLVEFGCDIPYLLRLPYAGILLPAVRDAPHKGDERCRSRNQDSLPPRAGVLVLIPGQPAAPA